MCLHPKINNQDSSSDFNKITEELNDKLNNMDSLSEFAGYCKYLDSIGELNSCDLKVLHLNVQSILSKQEDLAKLLIHNNIDVCTIKETWLKRENKYLLKLRDYSCVSTEHEKGRGSGVGIEVLNHLKYERRLDLE